MVGAMAPPSIEADLKEDLWNILRFLARLWRYLILFEQLYKRPVDLHPALKVQ